MKVNERFNWAVEMLHVHPADHILEIGCGHGIAVSLIAPELKTGSITAIDVSETMIGKAMKRNEANEASFMAGTLAGVELPERRFDKVFAFNVNVFHKNPGEELQLIRRYLAPNGALYIFHQPPPTDNMEVAQGFADAIAAQLKKNRFRVKDVLLKKLSPSPCVCVISQPAGQ
jgi:ubiquinone/menaquinone biosynthesis C-methylase UbiE